MTICLIGSFNNDSLAFISSGATLGALANTWHFYTVTKDASNNTSLYIDDNSTPLATWTSPAGSGSDWRSVGNYHGGLQPSGYCAKTMLYNDTVLTTSEIAQNFNADKARFGL